jgi:hypothetical protein
LQETVQKLSKTLKKPAKSNTKQNLSTTSSFVFKKQYKKPTLKQDHKAEKRSGGGRSGVIMQLMKLKMKPLKMYLHLPSATAVGY